MADLTLEAMSLKELRQLQKDLDSTVSTYVVWRKAEPHRAEAVSPMQSCQLLTAEQ